MLTLHITRLRTGVVAYKAMDDGGMAQGNVMFELDNPDDLGSSAPYEAL